MMPEPETIYAYDIIGTGWLSRSNGRCKTITLPLGSDSVSMEIHWAPRDSVRPQLLERHFQVDCVDNQFRLTPAKVTASEGKPLVDAFTLGNPSEYLIGASPEAIEHALKAFGRIAIAEHVTRSRLEMWRVAAVEGKPSEDVEALWMSYLEAETAITWSYPDVEWSFLMNEDQANELRAGPGF